MQRVAILALLLPFAALAEGPSLAPRLDVGAGSGLNDPSGIIGVGFELHTSGSVGLGLSGGIGAWGPRFSSQARLYLSGRSRGPFLEGGLSLNLGGSQETSETVTTNPRLEGIDGTSATARSELLPTPTTNLAVGYHFVVGERGFIGLRLGYSIRLRQDNIRRSGDQGFVAGALNDTFAEYSQPGGVILGMAGGFSVL